MSKKKPKSKIERAIRSPGRETHSGLTRAFSVQPSVDLEVPPNEAFLEQARMEPKRKLVTDHLKTIILLRDEKRFTFRGIADWLTARGIEADHSAVYRAYLAAIPEENRDPREDWSDVD